MRGVLKMDTKIIGDISKEHRESLGIPISEVSARINKHVSSLYRFENGNHKDPKGYILAYATLGDSDRYLRKVIPYLEERVETNG